MSSSPPRRSTSRGRSRTPTEVPRDPDTAMRSTSRSRTPTRNGTGRPLSRTPSRSRSRSPTGSQSPALPPSAKIVIEKLTRNIQPPHLREIFSSYGDISSIEMPMNTQFMTNRGIAYVLFETPAHAEAAIAHMHEAQLDGACISVSIVLPRRRWSVSPKPRRVGEDRFGEPRRFRENGGSRGGERGFGRRPSPSYRSGGRGSPHPMGRGGFRGDGRRGGGGGYRDRHDDRVDDRRSYRPRSYSPSRSPPRRRRSPSYGSRSRSPPPRRRPSPPRGGGGGGRQRRSPSYSSYSSRDRSPRRNR